MPTPVYVLAGQSNATALSGRNDGMTPAQVYATLTGSTDVRVATVAADGAPLTWGRAEADWYNSDELLAQLVGTIRSQLSQPDTTLADVLWIQGEGDSWDIARAAEYGSRLLALVDRLEQALSAFGGQTQDFRFTVLALSAHAPEGQDRANWMAIRAQQLALSDPRITVIDPDEVAAAAGLSPVRLFQADGLHYTASANALLMTAMMDHAGLSLIGTPADDRLAGLGGADVLRGGGGRDILQGSAGNDTIGGWIGDDSIYGGTGDDRIASGAGNDMIWGAGGADTFVFLATDPGTGRDRLMDFTSGQDRLDLSLIDADLGRAGNQAFRFLGASGFDGKPAALMTTHTSSGLLLACDMNGDRIADLTVLLPATPSLLASDLIL